jgi:RNA polymerase sigma-70 factor, ECF subfamily
MQNDAETAALLERYRGGDGEALGELFECYRERLSRMLALRLDPRLAARVCPDDILQESFLDISRRAGEYLADPAVPFYVWLRFLTIQRMQMVRRAHLEVGARDVSREARFPFEVDDYASPDSMAGQLAGNFTSPSQAAIRVEVRDQLRSALAEMDPIDREVLALRHFEELGNNEVAAILSITKDAASKRHIRALKRLREILSTEGA